MLPVIPVSTKFFGAPVRCGACEGRIVSGDHYTFRPMAELPKPERWRLHRRGTTIMVHQECSDPRAQLVEELESA